MFEPNLGIFGIFWGPTQRKIFSSFRRAKKRANAIRLNQIGPQSTELLALNDVQIHFWHFLGIFRHFRHFLGDLSKKEYSYLVEEQKSELTQFV